jgi:hypothetical protein
MNVQYFAGGLYVVLLQEPWMRHFGSNSQDSLDHLQLLDQIHRILRLTWYWVWIRISACMLWNFAFESVHAL